MLKRVDCQQSGVIPQYRTKVNKTKKVRMSCATSAVAQNKGDYGANSDTTSQKLPVYMATLQTEFLKIFTLAGVFKKRFVLSDVFENARVRVDRALNDGDYWMLTR